MTDIEKVINLNPTQQGGDGAQFTIKFKDKKLLLGIGTQCYGIHSALVCVTFDFPEDMIALGEALIEVGNKVKQ